MTGGAAVAKLRGLFDEHGPVWGPAYLLHTVLMRATGGAVRLVPYAFVAQPVTLAPYAALRDDPRTVVRRVAPDDAVHAAFPRPLEVNRLRHRSGSECHVVEVKGAFAGHLWLSRGRHAEDEVRCDYRLLPAGAAVWDFDVYVAPAYRSGRAMARLWKGVNSVLDAERVRWSFSRISLFNAASLQAHRRLGAVRVATGVFVVVGRLQVAVFSQAPFLHVSMGDKRRPELWLSAPAST